MALKNEEATLGHVIMIGCMSRRLLDQESCHLTAATALVTVLADSFRRHDLGGQHRDLMMRGSILSGLSH
jgi:hypothetical protein